jgi:hypothetical protein
VLREQQFSRVVPKKHLYFSILTTQDKIKLCQNLWREGRSVIPIQNRYLFSSCAPCPEICNLLTKPIVLLICFESFAQLRLNQYRSLLRIVTLTTCVLLFGNLKRQERQVAKTAPKCHRVTRQAGFQKATQLLSYIHYPTETCQLTSPQGEADVRSLEGV